MLGKSTAQVYSTPSTPGSHMCPYLTWSVPCSQKHPAGGYPKPYCLTCAVCCRRGGHRQRSVLTAGHALALAAGRWHLDGQGS